MNKGLIIKALKDNRGFTLIEVMIAIFILVITMLGVISVTCTVIRGNSFSKTMTTAITLAGDKIEGLKNTPYSSIAGGTDYAKSDSTIQSAQTSESIYTRNWVVNIDTPATGMKTITVSVSWNWLGARTVTLKTIVASL
jgi:type IV pilus assembly protein PilV